MRKRKKGKKREKRTAYFIRRKSRIPGDDSQYVHDEGRPIAFEKVTWASWFMRVFKEDQGARIVKRPATDADVDFREVLPLWLPETVDVEEYLRAIEQTTADIVHGRGPSQRAVKAFLRDRRRKFEEVAT